MRLPAFDIEAPPGWQETALARYPRKIKVGAACVLIAALVARMLFPDASAVKKNIHHLAEKPATIVTGLESKNANQIEGNKIEKISSAATSSIVNLQDDRSVQLSAAPDQGLSEDTVEGSLPRIGPDGRMPWQVYARPFNAADTRPRIAILITGLGFSQNVTDSAINQLPVNVTLAFDTRAPTVGAWCNHARQVGHETLLNIPMEPFDFPRSDPGTKTLLTSLSNADNLIRFQYSLHQASGYVGITTLSGSRFMTNSEKLDPIMDVLAHRGLLIVDAHIAPHSSVPDLAHERKIPFAVVNQQLDQSLTPEDIDAALDTLEQTAHLTGRAIGISAPYPIMIKKLQVWMKGLPERGIALAPVSAMVK